MAPSLAELIELRLRRREALGLGVGLGLGAWLGLGPRRAQAAERADATPEPWRETPHDPSARLEVASGHRAQTLLRWGDPVAPHAPPFKPRAQSPGAAALQLGYNCDHLEFFPLPRGSGRSDRGLLAINLEYTEPTLMFPRCSELRAKIGLTEAEIAIEMMSHGVAIVEVARRDGRWSSLPGALNRRITAFTPIRLSGPAAGHVRLQTAADPTGATVLGTLSNCAGGVTPWGTYLTAEENVHQYFAGPPLTDGDEVEAHKRYRIGQDLRFGWSRWHERFNPRLTPREPNRFGWIVEIDPFDPSSMPVKRTALGRCFHECATVALAPSGQVVVYSGDDAPFEYLYKFVSRMRYTPGADTTTLLDEGTLYVARLEPDGGVEWRPLVHGVGLLDAAHGFRSQADVVIEARRAADLLGATPLDRPEDVEIDPKTGAVFIALSRNDARTDLRVDGANPRAPNRNGHILVIQPPGLDHASREGRWEILLLAGDPDKNGDYSGVGLPTPSGWLSNPDNLAIDPSGRLWIATDGQNGLGRADGLHLLTRGTGPRRFLSAPIGAEVTGPAFTPDGTTLFVSIQHPGEGTSFDEPSTRWPDFHEGTPPRPSVVAIVRDDGGIVGG